MKANELMIGDWVMYHKHLPMKITNLYEGVDLTGLYPIPLTAEILEKNGWMKVEADGVFYGRQLKGELPWIGYVTDEDNWRFRIRDFCEIKYAHQLQHALRLCGIDKEIVL